jgi:hypothetical protein
MRSIFVALLLLAAAAPAFAQSPFGPDTAASPLALRGVITERGVAERSIAFRPFVPDSAPIEVALVPPFHGAQTVANEGIGYSYGRGGRNWILLQWRRNGGTLAAFPALPAERNCTDVHAVGGDAKPRGVAWATPRGLVFALTAEGPAEPATILTEFRRLVRRGACR